MTETTINTATINSAALQAHLTSVEDRFDPSRSLTDPPIVVDNPAAIDAYTRLGGHDAARPGADEHVTQRVLPASSGFVIEAARTPLVVLGEHFAAVRTAHAAGILGKVAAAPVTTRRVLRSMWVYLAVFLLVFIAALCIEVVYGHQAAMPLTGANSNAALVTAIATAIALNGCALFASRLLAEHQPGLARRRGGRIALGIAVLIALVAIILGLVVGDFDNASYSTVSGGGSAAQASVSASAGKPLTALMYMALLLLIAIGMAAGHLLIEDMIRTRHTELIIEERNRAAAASLDLVEQDAVALRLCDAFLSAIEAAHRQGRLRVHAYVSEVRRNSTPEMAEVFTYPVHDEAEPQWASDARAMKDGLLERPSHAQVTRIA